MRRLDCLLPLTLALNSGCKTDCDVVQSEFHLRLTTGSGDIALLLVERGVSSGGNEPEATSRAVGIIERVLQGARLLPPKGGLISLDFDAEQAEIELKQDADLDRDERRRLPLIRACRVEKAGLFLDEQERLCLYQLWRLGPAAPILAWINEKISRDLLEEEKPDRPFEARFPFLDEASWRLALAKACASGAWIRIEDGALVLELPMTQECAAKCMLALADEGALLDDDRALLRGATGLQVSDDRLVIRFGPGPEGWLKPPGSDPRGAYDPRFLEAVRDKGLVIGPAMTLEQANRLLRSR